MTTALDAEIVEVLKDLGGAVHVTQVRRGLRDRGGRPVSEELLLRLCRQSPRLCELGQMLPLLCGERENRLFGHFLSSDARTALTISLGQATRRSWPQGTPYCGWPVT